MDVGFIAKDLVAAGVDLDDIFGETAPVAVMKAAGISATGIKAEGLTRDWVNQTDWLKEMREAGYMTKPHAVQCCPVPHAVLCCLVAQCACCPRHAAHFH